MGRRIMRMLIVAMCMSALADLPSHIIAQDEKEDKQEGKKEKIKFEHPSIIITKEDIKHIKDAIKQGVEPQKTAFEALIGVAQRHLKGEPKPLEKMFIPYYYQDKKKHIASRGSLDNDCDAVCALALAYALTDDSTYADKALKYINAWVKSCKIESPAEDTPLLACRELALMVWGVDLLWNYNGFTKSDKEAFLKWSKGTVYEMGNATHKAKNNWGAWAIQGMMSYAILSEDEEKFYKVIELWKKHLQGNLNKNSEFRYELKRHDGPTGQGISYSQFALHGYTVTALMALNHDVDLFSYKTPDGVGLKEAAEKIFSWETEPDSFPYNKDYKQLTNKFYSSWEVLYQQYKVKEWGNKILELRKPPFKDTWHHNEGAKWLTLTHGLPIKGTY